MRVPSGSGHLKFTGKFDFLPLLLPKWPTHCLLLLHLKLQRLSTGKTHAFPSKEDEDGQHEQAFPISLSDKEEEDNLFV